MKNIAPLATTQQTPAIQPSECGQDALAPGEALALPQHPCGSRTFDPDEVFTDPGTLVMIGI
jgi:hypothetical protein